MSASVVLALSQLDDHTLNAASQGLTFPVASLGLNVDPERPQNQQDCVYT
jgi:hypothetical protein